MLLVRRLILRVKRLGVGVGQVGTTHAPLQDVAVVIIQVRVVELGLLLLLVMAEDVIRLIVQLLNACLCASREVIKYRCMRP